MTSGTADAARPATPWWFWVAAVVSLLWNCIGGYDYLMSHTQGEAYLRQMGMTDPQVAFMAAYPVWMHAVWAIGVWGSVLGSILLLLRMRWAFHAFVASFLGAAGSLLYTELAPGGAKTMGVTFPIIICIIVLALIWFSQTMTKRGVLR